MIYEQSKQSLYSENGELVKQFQCPLAKEWSRLSLTGNDLVRYCGSCSKNVADITSFDEHQMIAIFKLHPEQCSYLDFENAIETIEIRGEVAGHPSCIVDVNNDYPMIQTARGVKAINDAIQEGSLVDIRNTDVAGAICWNTRWVKGEDELIRPANQYSNEPGEFDSTHPQGYLDSSLSAYIIPRELAPGTEVYIPDVIEHIVESVHHWPSRLSSGIGIWDGTSVTVHEPEITFVVG